jgi:hypothetical protein
MPSTHVNHTRLQRTAHITLSRCTRSSKRNQTICHWYPFGFRDQSAKGIGISDQIAQHLQDLGQEGCPYASSRNGSFQTGQVGAEPAHFGTTWLDK